MPLVEAKCTNCGAALQVDDSLDAAICPYCNTAYIVEKAINNYNITNNVTNNISAGVVNVIGGNSDFEIKAGVLKKYKGSETEVIIPDGVKEIGFKAFYNYKYLTSVQLPNSITCINVYAFFDCKNLTSINIPDSVTTIGANAFKGCDNLSTIIGAEKYNPNYFKNTPWFYNYKRKCAIDKNTCPYCGGSYKGVLKKVCSNCGRPKEK